MIKLSDAERLQGYMDKIHEIRQNKLMTYDSLVKASLQLREDLIEVRKTFKEIPISERLEIIRYTGIVKSFSNEKAIIGELRQILAALHKEEARYEKEIMKLQMQQ